MESREKSINQLCEALERIAKLIREENEIEIISELSTSAEKLATAIHLMLF